jgi:hypothetical protein
MVVATNINVPRSLLTAVDRKTRSLRMSRNQLIIRALEREVAVGSDWSAGFFERLEDVDDEIVRAVDELTAEIRQARRSKTPPAL